MGSCGGRKLDEGEQFLRDAIKRMEMSTMTYAGLLKSLRLLAKDDLITKQCASDILEPLFEDHDKNDKVYKKAQRKLYDYVMTSLHEKTNIYQVIFYIYPFLNHRGEERIVKIYEIFNHINRQEMNYHKLSAWFKKYIELCTDIANNHIYYEMEPGKAKDELSKLISEVYTSDHINTKLNYYMEGLRADKNDNSHITEEEFVKHFRNFDFSSFEDIRDRFLIDYGKSFFKQKIAVLALKIVANKPLYLSRYKNISFNEYLFKLKDQNFFN